MARLSTAGIRWVQAGDEAVAPEGGPGFGLRKLTPG